MNKIIESYIKTTYGFEVKSATPEDLRKVTEIMVSDKTMSHENSEWDFSVFPNLKKIDCSYNPIDSLKISNNHELEYIRFEGARGNIPHKIDFSGNPHLKVVRSGQDGVTELDFSTNYELEDLSIFLNSSLRWVNIDNCSNLKKINMQGANIPFVDLTHCNNLESVTINYLNLYKNRDDEFGPGYPRPIIFVTENFDENIIDRASRENKYFTYYLIRVKENSIEKEFLQKVKSMKETILSIPPDNYGGGVARMHYQLLDIYESLKPKIISQKEYPSKFIQDDEPIF